MGLMIDGDFVKDRNYDDLSPYRQRRTEHRSPAKKSGLLLAAGVLLGAAAVLLTWKIDDTRRFEAATEGKCFQTAAGAVGIVDTLYGSSSVKLSFPSGVNASYDFSRLHEVPCTQMDDGAPGSADAR